MLFGLLTFISALISWWIGLAFIRAEKHAVWFNSTVSALLTAFAAALLKNLGLTAFTVPSEFAVFLITMVVFQLQTHCDYADCAAAFLLAQACFAALNAEGFAGETTEDAVHVAVRLLYMASFVPAAFVLHGYFPDPDWKSFFSDSVQEPGRIGLKLEHVYALYAGLCICLTAVMFLTLPEGLLCCVAKLTISAVIFWLGMVLAVFMNHYKKERASLLLEQQYRGEMQVFLNVIRSQRHDYNFHVQTIAGLFRSGKLEECRKYVDALETDSSLMNALLPVKDPAIAAMIHNFRILAVKTGIEIQVDIQNDLSQISTNVYETNKIISNLLQNAIDETASHRDKSFGIRLQILKRGEYCVIRVSNQVAEIPTEEQLGLIFRQGYTTKQGHDGVGLSSIRTLAKRYRGTIYTELDGNVLSFVAKIPVNVARSNKTELEGAVHGN